MSERTQLQHAILFALLIALGSFGCGGGGSSSSFLANRPGAITVSVSPNSAILSAGATTQFTATVINDSAAKGVTWTLSCSGSCGTLSATSTASGTAVTYTAPPSAPSSNVTVTLTATSVSDPTKSASATITLPAVASITVSVSPSSGTVQPGATLQLIATVKNDLANAGVNWELSCSPALAGQPGMPCGTLSQASTASGTPVTYTAPSAGDLLVAITAISISNGTSSAVANLTVPGIGISINPGSTTVNLGAKAQFTATVTNDGTNKGVTWTLMYTVNGGLVPCPSATVCGSVSPTSTASGAPTTYTAPSSPSVGDLEVALTATSVADSAASAQAFITVPGINISISPSFQAVEATTTQQFTATVTGDPNNKGVTWTVSCSATDCGTLSLSATASGAPTTYTAPSTPPASDLSVTLTATSVTNTGASATATALVPAITISVRPLGALLPLSIAQPFTATLANDPTTKGIAWSIMQGGAACSTCGTVIPSSTASGDATTYTAPASLPPSPTVTLTATSAEDSSKSISATIKLTQGTVELVPNILIFPTVLVGSHAPSQQITLTNTGTSALTITGITIGGTNPGDFAQTNTCGSSVSAGNSCTITVTFTARALGLRTATVSIADSSTDSPQQVSLTGHGFTHRPRFAEVAPRSPVIASSTASVPAPEGPEKVGTLVLHLIDSDRKDPYLHAGAARELAVRFWYPAALVAGCKPAPYNSARVWDYYSSLLGLPLPQVSTNSCSDAPVAAGRHPVVIFTPGYTATFTDYTFIVEDLASRGYIVASVDHTYEATAVELSNRTLAKSVFGSHLAGKLRGDAQSLSFANSVRLDDLRFIVSELARLNSKPSGHFNSRFDMTRIAIAGHSMGAAAAFLETSQDPRIKAAILMDGYIPESMLRQTRTPVLILAMGVQNWSHDQCQLWQNLQGPRAAINFPEAEHVTPSDALWLLPGLIKAGPMGRDRTIAAIRDSIATFLGANLRHDSPKPALAELSLHFSDAAVTSQKQALCH